MKSAVKFTQLLIILGITVSACGPTYYAPNSLNIPIIKEKGQTNISDGINITDFTSGFEIQGAYGLTDKIALQFNTDFVNGDDTTENSGSGHLIEVGTGYYKVIAPKLLFETYGLIGLGGVNYKDSNDNYYTGSISSNFWRFGIQPSMSFSSKYFTASLSTRLANLHYYNINGNLSYNNYEKEADYLKNNNSQWVVEPGLTLQAGGENLKLQLQLVESINITNENFPQDYVLVSLGLKMTLTPRK